MMNYFEELELDFALINETWLATGKYSSNNIIDLEVGNNIGMVCKNRKGKSGGGVAIFYKLSRIEFKKEPLRECPFEVVAASAKIEKTGRVLIAVALYLPPGMQAPQVRRCFSAIHDNLAALKVKYGNPLVIIGGDFNRQDPEALASPYPEMEVLRTGPSAIVEDVPILGVKLERNWNKIGTRIWNNRDT